jgi:hypothetical protein
MTNRALVVESAEAKEISKRIALVVPGGADIPPEVRLGMAQLALLHGLDPFMGEIMAIKQKGGGYVPYVGIVGTRRASREQIDYERVLLPLNDYWADEYFHMTEEQLRQANGMHAEDIVWFCAIYVVGKERPFVELGVCGPGFPTVSRAPYWKMAKKRAEAAALKAACDLPFTMTGNGDGEPDEELAIEGEVAVIDSEPERGYDTDPAEWGGPLPSAVDEFLGRVCRQVPYFKHPAHVTNTLAKLELEYNDHPQAEASLFEILNDYATRRADEKAAAEAVGGKIIGANGGKGADDTHVQLDPEQATMPW